MAQGSESIQLCSLFPKVLSREEKKSTTSIADLFVYLLPQKELFTAVLATGCNCNTVEK